MKHLSVRRLVVCALLAAIYAVLTIATGFMSYGNLQFRIAEALCVLPAIFPFTTWGLFIGCILANLISPTGVLDVVFGSLATLAASCCIAVLGSKRSTGRNIAVCLMPVLWNGVVLGAMFALTGEQSWVMFPAMFAIFGGEIALGEAAVMFLLGLPLLRALQRGKLPAALQELRDETAGQTRGKEEN